jgi:hypothetical protein
MNSKSSMIKLGSVGLLLSMQQQNTVNSIKMQESSNIDEQLRVNSQLAEGSEAFAESDIQNMAEIEE